MKDVKIVFLKRNTTEIQFYIRKIAIDSFYTKLNAGDAEFVEELQSKNLLHSLEPMKQIDLQKHEASSKEAYDQKILQE